MSARGEKVRVKCARCKQPFMARVADRKRGWGKFCSKSCKAIKQTQRTGYAGPHHYDDRDGFTMTPGELTMGGYGDATDDTPFGDGKW